SRATPFENVAETKLTTGLGTPPALTTAKLLNVSPSHVRVRPTTLTGTPTLSHDAVDALAKLAIPSNATRTPNSFLFISFRILLRLAQSATDCSLTWSV